MTWKYSWDYLDQASMILHTLILLQDKQWDPIIHDIEQKHWTIKFKAVVLCLGNVLTLGDKTRNLGRRILPEGTEMLESDGDTSEELRN